jgi:hypothetical protein
MSKVYLCREGNANIVIETINCSIDDVIYSSNGYEDFKDRNSKLKFNMYHFMANGHFYKLSNRLIGLMRLDVICEM